MKRQTRVVRLFGAFSLLLLLPAAAEAQDAPPTAGLPDEASPIPDNPYSGVVPGATNPPPRVDRIERSKVPLVTWPGFQMMGAGSRIFVQTSGAVAHEEARGPNRLVVRLQGCKIHARNNRNPLVTRHFNTPVSEAYLKPRRRDVDLVIELRADVRPLLSQSQGPNGFYYLFVEFPAGSYLPAGAEGGPIPVSPSSPPPSSLESPDESEQAPMQPGETPGPTP